MYWLAEVWSLRGPIFKYPVVKFYASSRQCTCYYVFFSMACRLPRLNLFFGGMYRRLLTQPRNLSWSFSRQPSQPPRLLEPLNAATVSAAPPSTNGGSVSHDHHMGLAESVEGREEHGSSEIKVKDPSSEIGPTLNLKFDLGKGMYATMLLRELTKLKL